MSSARETSRARRSSLEVCAGAASEMREILDSLEEYSGIYEETAALRKRLDRIERACAGVTKDSGGAAPDPAGDGGDPKTVARGLIARMPLRRVFQDPTLTDAFLSELMLALARESAGESRRERQRQGIEEAKAQGVRFGAPKRPLPENFEEVRRAWRAGGLTLVEAAKRCGMARSTFYNAAQRSERAAREAAPEKGSTAPPSPERRRERPSLAGVQAT